MSANELPVPRTAEGLRDALFDEINGIRAGTTTPQRARAVAQLAGQVIDSLRVQIQTERLLLAIKKKKKPLLLGTPK